MSYVGNLRECEKIDFTSDRSWLALPSMREGKTNFNPCLFNGYVYVCGYGSSHIEAFSPQTDSFLSFQLEMPGDNPCCLYIHNDELVVQSKSNISMFQAEETGKIIKYSHFVRDQDNAGHKSSNCPPVVDRTRNIVFILQNGECQRFIIPNKKDMLEVQQFPNTP